MSEKSNNEQHKKEDGTESKKKESGGNATIVLKTDLHCQGCTSKILKCIRTFEGVVTADIGNGQITVVGKMDPAKLRERVEKKTLKKVEVVTLTPPKTKKGDNKDKDKDKDKDKAKNVEKKKEDNAEKKKDPPQGKNTEEKKSKDKEPCVTTTQLKVHLHCEGCIQKIQKIIVKTKGYKDMKIDKQKEIVTVTGVVDMKALAEALKKNLKRDVQLVPPKKEAVKKENPGGEKANKGKSEGKAGGGENNKMQVQVLNQYPYPYTYPIVYESNPYAYGPSHAPQLFSDENPNACNLM